MLALKEIFVFREYYTKEFIQQAKQKQLWQTLFLQTQISKKRLRDKKWNCALTKSFVFPSCLFPSHYFLPVMLPGPSSGIQPAFMIRQGFLLIQSETNHPFQTLRKVMTHNDSVFMVSF